ncbi:MAG: hypothetical protein Kow0099_34560 [Candidatus Abyssubacteria bacterium]
MNPAGHKASIGIFESGNYATGGQAYRSDLRRALEKRHDVCAFNVSGDSRLIPSARLRRMHAIWKVKAAKHVWIRDFYPVAGMSLRRNSGRNIALFFHMYTEGPEADMLGRFLTALFYRNIARCDRVVVIAEFWRDYLRGRGVHDARVIRSGMDPNDFRFQPDEVRAFVEKHALTGAPIVYIGNCRKNKGVVEVHEVLKGRGYILVTSGPPEVALPCPNFDLSYREYCLLLKASSVVVTMSKFREGWCRTAHEAMLCKTPVIGSGAGGMAELLEGGKQYICRDISDLPGMVEAAMRARETIGEDGYRFVRELTVERFEKQWVDLIAEVLEGERRE